MSDLFTVNLPLIYMALILLGAILVDLLLGVGAAFKTGTFSLTLLPQFLQSQIMTYYLPIVGLIALAQVNWAYFGVNASVLGLTTDGTITAAWAAIGAYGLKVLLVNIKANLYTIFGITGIDIEKQASVVKKAEGFIRLSILLVIMAVVVVLLLCWLL
jgi:hypothetical protein